MIELFKSPGLVQLYKLMAEGSPPMFFRLLALNLVLLAIFVARRALSASLMRRSTAIFLQVMVVAANLLVLLQEPVTATILRVLKDLSRAL